MSPSSPAVKRVELVAPPPEDPAKFRPAQAPVSGGMSGVEKIRLRQLVNHHASVIANGGNGIEARKVIESWVNGLIRDRRAVPRAASEPL